MQIMDPTTHLWLVEQDRERAMTQRALERAARAGGSPRPGEIRGGISLARILRRAGQRLTWLSGSTWSTPRFVGSTGI
jgi:hypothetical protein